MDDRGDIHLAKKGNGADVFSRGSDPLRQDINRLPVRHQEEESG